MRISWRDLILAWLHDPPDKALSIVDHVSRARRYAREATEVDVGESDLDQHADVLASATERLPMPKGDVDARRVGPGDRLCMIHPLSASRRELPADSRIDEAIIANAIRETVAGLEGPERDASRFFALWRLLPGRLASRVNRLA